MFQYRAVLVRLRQGDTDRDIARARLMGRPKTAALRAIRWCGQSEMLMFLTCV